MKANAIYIGRNFLTAVLAIVLTLSGFKPAQSQQSSEMVAMNSSSALSAEGFLESSSISFYYSEVEEEESLDIEEWMSNDKYWGYQQVLNEQENKPLPWMWCDNFWSGKLCEALLKIRVELEGDLQVEAWMYDNAYWK
jgi:hypothetical protein